jgi:hypothetical protein
MSAEVAAFLGAIVGGAVVVIGQIILSHKESEERRKLSKIERIDKYTTIAIEKKLECHQKAFSLWFDLMRLLNAKENVREAKADECENFWKDYNFYLDKESSDAFKTAITVATYFGKYISRSDRDISERKKDFHTIYKVGNLLRTGIGLPHLQDRDTWEREIFGE